MKKVKKSTWVTVALLIYVSATAAYLLPRNHEVSDTEKYLTLAASYVIVLVLWLVLRKKEQMQQRRANQRMGAEVMSQRIREMSDNDPRVVALVIRQWMGNEHE